LQDWKKSGLAALLPIVVLAGCLFASGREEEAEEIALSEPPQQVEERPAHQVIEGSDRTGKTLNDPFTMGHETREEKGKAAEMQKVKARAAQERSPSKQPPALPAQVPKVAAFQEPKLKGIISGASGQLALVDYGDRSLTLAVGEGADGIQLLAVEPKRVLVGTPQGEKWLELP
jgi:hypothetical protein